MRITIIPTIPLGSSVSKIDKLNVTQPYSKVISLEPTINLADVVVSVFEYITGADTNILNLAFDNGDSSNFSTNENLLFDGTMSVKTDYTYEATEDVGTPSVFESSSINISDFQTIDVLTFETDLIVIGYVGGQIATPINYIDLSGIEQINSITLVTTQDVGTDLLYALDFGLGQVAWNGSDWVSVSDISIDGMTPVVVNGLTTTQLELGRNDSNQLKVIYYMDPTDTSSVAENDNIIIEVQLLATLEIANQTDFSYTFDNATKELTVSFTKSGTYKINYIGGI